MPHPYVPKGHISKVKNYITSRCKNCKKYFIQNGEISDYRFCEVCRRSPSSSRIAIQGVEYSLHANRGSGGGVYISR